MQTQIKDVAGGLASLGRYGDTYMVHAAEGETVIPAEILQANPQLKLDLFRQMRMMGIQDPNRYIVGNTLNSLNPVTGQPEFFFKKFGKSLKKALKKLAPIIGFAVGAYLTPRGAGRGLSSFIPGVTTGLATKLAGGSTGKSIAYGGLGALAGGTLLGRQGMITGTRKTLAPSQNFSRKFTGTLNEPPLAPVYEFSAPYDARRPPVFKGEPDFRKTIPYDFKPVSGEDLSIQPNLRSYPTIHEGEFTSSLPNIQSDQSGIPPDLTIDGRYGQQSNIPTGTDSLSLSQIYEGIPSG